MLAAFPSGERPIQSRGIEPISIAHCSFDLETDTGLVGWGEAFVTGPMAEATVSELFADDVVGMDPFDVESLAERSYTDPYHLGEASPFRAASARLAWPART